MEDIMWRYVLFLTSATLSHAVAPTSAPAPAADTTSLTPPFHSSFSTQSYMMIAPAARAQDLKQAYEALKREKTAGKVFFELTDGSRIFNVIEMIPMSNSTLVLFRVSAQEGIHFQVVRIEDIANVSY